MGGRGSARRMADEAVGAVMAAAAEATERGLAALPVSGRLREAVTRLGPRTTNARAPSKLGFVGADPRRAPALTSSRNTAAAL